MFYYLISLALRVLIYYKITTRAKLLDNIRMELVRAVDCTLIDLNVTKCMAVSPTFGLFRRVVNKWKVIKI